MTRKGWTRGKAVVNQELRYVSPSQIVAADHDSFGGCLRRWFYRRVENRPEPEGAGQKQGTAGHSEIEEYLTTGKMVLGEHALKAKRYLPAPDPALQVEVPIDDGTLTFEGLPVVGFVDWVNTTGRVELDDETRSEPLEVVDWKFTGRKDFPSSSEVGDALPMAIYGHWAMRKYDVDRVRLSHVYISKRQRHASKRSLTILREDVRKLERAETIVRRLQQAARSTASEVDANTSACTAYGGCPHRAYCKAGTEKTLVDLLGATAAHALTNNASQRNSEDLVSLLNIPALAKAKAQLIADEQAAKVDPALKAAVEAIKASGYGQPSLTGDAAKAWAAATGLDFQGHGLTGSGMLAQATFSDPADLIKAAEELKGMPTPLLPPDAPKSEPEKVATRETIVTPPDTTAPSVTSVQAAQPDTTAPAAVVVTTAEDSGELKLSKKARAHVQALEARIAELEQEILARKVYAAPSPAPTAGVTLYVDCFPPQGTTDLAPWIHAQAKRLADQYAAADIRCADEKSPLAFGKWKGALAAMIRHEPPANGDYYLDARGSEIAEVAAEALCGRARVIRGIR